MGVKSYFMNNLSQRSSILRNRQFGLIGFFFLLIASNIMAQSMDPESEKYIQSIQEKYTKMKGYEVDFSIKMKYPEEEGQIITGQYWSKQKQYKIEMDDQIIVSNGQDQWIYNKEDELVSIYDAEDAEFTISPQGIFDMLKSDEYSYAMTFSGVKDGTKINEIEFKPNDEYSDFFKARLTVGQDNKDLRMLETFYRDGSRVTISLKSFKEIVKEDPFFVFVPEQYGDIEVEDLRW